MILRPDTFEIELRTAMQVQAYTLRRLELSAVDAKLGFSENQVVSQEILELQEIMAELEAGAGLLGSQDLSDFEIGDIHRIYEQNRVEISSDLAKVGYKDWDSFVRQTRALAAARGLDPLAPFDALLTEKDFEKIKNESYESGLRWDQTDYLFVFASGILAALTDSLLVRIPEMRRTAGSQFKGQPVSPLTKFIKKENTNKGESDNWFAEWARQLEKVCKTPYDRQHAILDDELVKIPGMGGPSHRFQSFGHDPVLGFVFGVLDILRGTITGFSYDNLAGTHDLFQGKVYSPLPIEGVDKQVVRLIEAILKHIGHLISDVATPMGLPAPFMTLFQGINAGTFGEKGRSAGEVARWMYLNGYDFRHFLVSGVTPAVIEIVLRAYIMVRHYSEHGETKFMVAQDPKYRSMLLTAHSVAAAANAGKVALHQGNPLAINQAEWMAFLRYLLPHMKYWMFDRDRLKIQHMEQINESGWNDLLASSDQLLSRVVAKEWNVVDLGLYRDDPSR